MSGGDTSVVGTWDGALVQYACAQDASGYDCGNVGCSNGMVTKKTSWTIGGTSGTVYDVTFNVRGVVETRWYPETTRDAGTDSITKNKDLFARGGRLLKAGEDSYDYNSYEIDVTPAVQGQPNMYFLNSVIQTENPHTSQATQHLTFPINYTKTIKVPGGGTVSLTSFDSNCRMVQNCGPTQGNQCAKPVTVDLGGTMPAAPTSFMQPFQMPTGRYGQWVFFDITKVQVAQ